MPRRAETPREREARARLKKRHAAEVKACGKFFDIADRRATLEAELAQLESEESRVVAELTSVADPAAVADMIGWSSARVRTAIKAAPENRKSSSVTDSTFDDDVPVPS